MNSTNPPAYGVGDATYLAAGGLEGITRVVEQFYANMDRLPEARELRAMHAQDLTESRRKLQYFLSGWMGGPKLYAQHYGSISIPAAHSHLPVDESSKNAWLRCMELALEEVGYPGELCEYLMAKLAVPAESIRLMCDFKRNAPIGTGDSQ